MKPGLRNLISDVPGILVGNSTDLHRKSGVTVITSHKPFVAAVHVMGGAPGTRETDLLDPDKTVDRVDALVLAGGSALGLAAASGVADVLRAQGKGFDVAGQKVPIVPAAILFDLLNGGDKSWDENPYPAMGRAALAAAAADFELGSHGAGTGATTAGLKGGLGSASAVLETGHTVGALAAVNAVGSSIVDDGPQFWAAPWELEDEFGGRGMAPSHEGGRVPDTKVGPLQNTTIAVVATDAKLTKVQAKRMAVAAHDGLARALVPSHTIMDGDLVFAVSTGERPVDNNQQTIALGHAAACVLARAIARGVYEATSVEGDTVPCWQDKFSR